MATKMIQTSRALGYQMDTQAQIKEAETAPQFRTVR